MLANHMKTGFERLVLSTVFAVLLVLACSSKETEPSAEASPSLIKLAAEDTIGIELGDSNYVFGNIVDAAFLPGGRIALLDLRKHLISIFDSEGNFLFSFGGEGAGPGEFAEPVELAVLNDGRLAVCDYMNRKLVFFDAELELQGELTGFFHTPPYGLENGPGGSIAGIQSHYYMEDDVPWFGCRLGTWTDSPEPDLICSSAYVVPDDGSIELYFATFCTDSRGRMYTADLSFDDYLITGYGPEGDTLFHLEEPYERTWKTDEELQAVHLPYRYSAGFTPEEIRAMSDRWEPEPKRLAISDIYCDSRDRIWVRTGRRESLSPLFEVYDTTGVHITTVQTDFGPEANNWKFVFGDSTVLTFDTNPDDYSKVLVLRIEEE